MWQRGVSPAAGILILTMAAGCFTPQLLDVPYQEPIQSQREFTEEFNNPLHLGNRWKSVSGWWSIKEGQLFQNLPWRSSLPGDFQMVYVDGLASGPYVVETRLCFLRESDQAAGILLRFQDQNNFYLLRMRHYREWQDAVDLTQYVGGLRREDLRRVDFEVVPGEWYTLRAEDRGTEIAAFVNGQELFRYPTKDRPVGTVGLATQTGRVAFDRFTAMLHESESNEGSTVSESDEHGSSVPDPSSFEEEGLPLESTESDLPISEPDLPDG